MKTPPILDRERPSAELQSEEFWGQTLGTISDILTSFLDLKATVQKMAGLAIPQLADICLVSLSQAERIEHFGGAHADPAQQHLIEVLRSRWTIDFSATHGVPLVLRTGRPVVRLHVEPSMFEPGSSNPAPGTQHPPFLEALRALKIRSFMILPLKSDQKTYGAMVLASTQDPERYAHHELQMGEKLARLCALAIEKSRLCSAALEAEDRARRYARRIQIITDVSDAFSSVGLDLNSVLDVFVRQVAEVIGDGCTIRLLSEDGKWLEPVAFHHANPKAIDLLRKILSESRHLLGEGLAGRVAQTGKGEIITQLSQEQAKQILKKEHWGFLDQFRIHSMIVVPLRVKGRVIGAISLYRDDTEAEFNPSDEQFIQALADRAAQAIENARLYASAQKAIQTRDEFLSMAAHELNTPLTSLSVAVQMLSNYQNSEKLRDPAIMQQLVVNSRHQVNRLAAMIKNLLNASRIHGNTEIPLREEELELNATIRKVIELFQTEQEHSHTPIAFESSGPIRGRWDPFWLEQILGNLIGNAIKYGGGKPARILAERQGTCAVIQVMDQGIGIAPDRLNAIFERFERAVPAQSFGGFGIGLFIVKRMAELMGGSIQVESEPNQGSNFILKLPLFRENQQSTQKGDVR